MDCKQYLNKEKLWHLFKYFDSDDDGFIKLQDIEDVFAREGRKLPEGELKQMLNEIGAKKQGVLDLEDFSKMMIEDIDEIKLKS